MSEQIYNLAFVFPGQGSQSVGMMSALGESFPVVKEIFEQASDALSLNLWELVTNGPAEELNKTHNTQPAMLTAGYAIWQLWQQLGGAQPSWMAGHSLGEYTALVCSQAMNLEDAVRLVAERGRLMQEAVPEGKGAMAAVLGLEDHEVVKACNDAAQGEVVAPVNYNAPGQVVIAGHVDAVNRAMAVVKELGAKRAVLLPVSVPSHCQLMQPAAEKLEQSLSELTINTPSVTLIHNVDVTAHSATEVIKNALKEQLYKPVRWVEGIKFMADQGVDTFVECGPGKVLIGLNKRIIKTANHFSLYDPETLEQAMEKLSD